MVLTPNICSSYMYAFASQPQIYMPDCEELRTSQRSSSHCSIQTFRLGFGETFRARTLIAKVAFVATDASKITSYTFATWMPPETRKPYFRLAMGATASVHAHTKRLKFIHAQRTVINFTMPSWFIPNNRFHNTFCCCLQFFISTFTLLEYTCQSRKNKRESERKEEVEEEKKKRKKKNNAHSMLKSLSYGIWWTVIFACHR